MPIFPGNMVLFHTSRVTRDALATALFVGLGELEAEQFQNTALLSRYRFLYYGDTTAIAVHSGTNK